MYREKKIGVVVSAYNEEEKIVQVIDTMPKFVDRIIVANDSSLDQISDVVAEHQKSAPDRFVLLYHDNRRGVGGEILTGYRWARENGLGITAVMAGDGQMDPIELSH